MTNRLVRMIRFEMDRINMTSAQLADMTYYSRGFISKLLSGKLQPPDPDKTDLYKALADSLGLSRIALEDAARVSKLSKCEHCGR